MSLAPPPPPDQSFDIPDRTFHSMNTTWRLSSFESMTDVKELIPEFFYLPEFMLNSNNFDLGTTEWEHHTDDKWTPRLADRQK